MTALSAPAPGTHVPDAADAEPLGRRALGLDAAFCAAVGSAAVVAGGPIARQVALPAWLVRLTGIGVIGWAGAVGTWSVAEEWQPPARRVVAANGLATAALLGHAVAKGTPRGRAGVVVLAAAVAGFAYAQARALIAAEPRPTS